MEDVRWIIEPGIESDDGEDEKQGDSRGEERVEGEMGDYHGASACVCELEIKQSL